MFRSLPGAVVEPAIFTHPVIDEAIMKGSARPSIAAVSLHPEEPSSAGPVLLRRKCPPGKRDRRRSITLKRRPPLYGSSDDKLQDDAAHDRVVIGAETRLYMGAAHKPPHRWFLTNPPFPASGAFHVVRTSSQSLDIIDVVVVFFFRYCHSSFHICRRFVWAIFRYPSHPTPSSHRTVPSSL